LEAPAVTLPNQPRPQIFGTGLIALDLVISADPTVPVRAWTGGTCGNVLSILAVLGWEVFPIARMNGDPASQRIRADMKKWGVQLKYASCKPATDTPIIIQHILRTRDGSPKHRFSWACPHCGSWLPSFKPVTTKAVERVFERLDYSRAFFMDRLSRSSLLLAKHAANAGAVVVFEPSAKTDEKHLAEALNIAHVVKYSDDRVARIPGAMEKGTSTIVEVQTFGANGLRFRHRLGHGVSSWKQLDAVQPVHVADTCGSGDWCTAGLISKIASNGQDGLRGARLDDLVEALRFGQRLAAWNVGFEGARGAMYAFDLNNLEKHLQALDSGRCEIAQSPSGRKKTAPATVACPLCPPGSKQTRFHKALDRSSA
jgi:sugar/nucleoside kinase (ribokinase family)